MNTDHTIRSTENSANSPSYRFRMTATDTSNQFIELFASLTPAAQPQQPASLLAADVDSKLDERDYAKQQSESQRSEKSESKTSPSQEKDNNDDSTYSDPVICCFWNETTVPPVVVKEDQVARPTTEPAVQLEQPIVQESQVVEGETIQLTAVETPETNDATALSPVELEAETQPVLKAAEPVTEATTTVEAIETNTASTTEVAPPGSFSTEATEDLQVVHETPEEASADAEIHEKIERWTEEKRNPEVQRPNKSEHSAQDVVAEHKPVNEQAEQLPEKTVEVSAESTDDENVSVEETPIEDSAEELEESDDPKVGRRIRRDGSRTYKTSAEQESDNPNAGKKQEQIPSLKQRLAAAASVDETTATGETGETNSEATSKSTFGSNVATAIGSNRILKAAGTKFESQLASAISEVSGKPSSNSNTPTVATTSGEQKIQAASSGSVKQTAKATLQRLPPQTINRITSALKEAPDGNSTMRLRLNPIELGNIDIEIAFKGGVMSAKLKAENGQTQQMLQEGIESLKTRLAEHGISVESLDVELGTDSQSSGGNNPSGQELDSGQDRRQSGFFEQQKQQRQQTVDKRTSPTEESPNKEVDAVGPWAVNVVA